MSQVPRFGTSGEKFREDQFEYQIPRQDIGLAFCKYLEKSKYIAYEDYVELRNRYALDVGYAKPFTASDPPTVSGLRWSVRFPDSSFITC